MAKKKILIVDDDPEFVELLGTRLTANDYKVLKAYDSVQAVKIAYEEKPDLILLDYKMPGGDGVSVYDKLRASAFTEKTPVIFMTGYPTDALKDMVLYMGAKDFIVKPFDSGELLTKIKKAIESL